MKRCPQCRRDYFDDSLFFCLDDGTALLEGPASGNTATLQFQANGSETIALGKWTPIHQNLTKIWPAAMLSDSGDSIVGRKAELNDIEELLSADDSRLITLTGIGGTGKTRLAKEVGRRAGDLFPAGVFFVELETVSDPAMVAPAIAHALGLNEESAITVSDILTMTLRDQEALLILDNFEQVIAAAVHVASLLHAAPRIKVLITSREPLKLSIEREYRVPPLALPAASTEISSSDLMKFEAVQLFVKCAKRARSDFELTDENANTVADICGKLDGLPLAVELAAARTRVLAPNEILARLDDRLALLTGGSRDLPGRQQTMRAALEWSCELLDEHERRVLAALAVFEGGFTFKAAETVVSQGAETLDLITSLTDKSLLMSKRGTTGELRFWMLQLVRDHASDLLSRSGEEEDMRRRHAHYFHSLACEAEPKLRTPETVEWLDLLETEHDNLRAALRWSIEKEPELALGIAANVSEFWTMHGHIREAENWLDQVLSRFNARNSEVRWTVQTALGTIKQFRGELARSLELYSDALETARALKDPNRIARSFRGLAAVEYISSDFENALQHTEESLKITRSLDDEFGTAAGLARLGDIALAKGHSDDSAKLTGEALETFRKLGYVQGVAAKLSNLAAAEISRGNLDDAESNLTEGLKICLEIGDTTIARLILDGLAAVRAYQGSYDDAARICGFTGRLADLLGLLGEPAEEELKRNYLAELEINMDPAALENRRAEGRRMSLEEVAALALRTEGQ
jgi:predicted ATPase